MLDNSSNLLCYELWVAIMSIIFKTARAGSGVSMIASCGYMYHRFENQMRSIIHDRVGVYKRSHRKNGTPCIHLGRVDHSHCDNSRKLRYVECSYIYIYIYIYT